MVVVVDDHFDSGRALTVLLSKEGVPSKQFTNGADAIAELEGLEPSVVVLDQMMPDSLGTEVLQSIRAMPAIADTPVIFYAATYLGMNEAKRLGAIAWLIKGKTSWTELRDCILPLHEESLKSRRPTRINAATDLANQYLEQEQVAEVIWLISLPEDTIRLLLVLRDNRPLGLNAEQFQGFTIAVSNVGAEGIAEVLSGRHEIGKSNDFVGYHVFRRISN